MIKGLDLCLDSGTFLQSFIGLVTSWMSEVLPSAQRLFSKMWLASQAGPGPKNPIPKVNRLCGKFSRAHCSCLCLACCKV